MSLSIRLEVEVPDELARFQFPPASNTDSRN
jgi:hypothetical protein